MENNRFKLYWALAPLSFLYGIGAGIRNRLFDWGVLPSQRFDLPVISVGNLTVGGTGKTPHIEYLIELLSERYNVAVLSRGYKRKSRGFVLAGQSSTAVELGDEPYQLKNKYPFLTVAVDTDRRNGIRQLMQLEPPVDIILLDDAFQHRYVTPSFSILLTDFSRPIYEDRLMPVGRLRESIWEKKRADVVIVTKCPEGIKPMDFRIIQKYMELYPYQELFFSTFRYDKLQPLGPKQKESSQRSLEELDPSVPLLIVTGIASTGSLERYLEQFPNPKEYIRFGDHHAFTKTDLATIEKRLEAFQNRQAFIVVTEKDAARLQHHPHLSERLRNATYYLPVSVLFLQEESPKFNNKIMDHVRKNRRSRRVS